MKMRLKVFCGILKNDINTLRNLAVSVAGVLLFQLVFGLWIIYMEYENIMYICEEASGFTDVLITDGRLNLPIELIQPLLVIAIPISLVAMINKLFSAYTKKESSDYYHSLPISRTGLYISHVITSVVLSVSVYLVMSIVDRAVFKFFLGKHINIVGAGTGKLLIFSLVLGLMLSGALAFARVLTNNGLSAFFTTLFILLFPRTLLMFIKSIIAKSAPYVVIRYGIFDDNGHNLIFGMIQRVLKNGTSGFYGSSSDTIYSLVLALVYFVFAYFIFLIRKDEMLDNYINNRRGLFIYSFVKGLKYSLIPIAALTAWVLEKSNAYASLTENAIESDKMIIIISVLFYTFGIVMYFKDQIPKLPKYKNYKTVFGGFVVLILINLGFIFGINAYVAKQKDRISDASDINYIVLDDVRWDGVENEFYSRLDGERIEQEDEKLLYTIYLMMEHRVKTIDQRFDNKPVIYVNAKSGGFYRYILMDKNEFLLNSLSDENKKNEFFSKKSLPSPQDILTKNADEDTIEWYKTYYDEIMAHEEEYYTLLVDMINGVGIVDDEESYGYQEISEVFLDFEIDGKKSRWGFPVIPQLEKSMYLYENNISGGDFDLFNLLFLFI